MAAIRLHVLSIFLQIFLICSLAQAGHGLISCYSCKGASSEHDCKNQLVQCPSISQACQTVVDHGILDKHCRNMVDCWREAQAECTDGKCSYCCDTDRCNLLLPHVPSDPWKIPDDKDSDSGSSICDPNPCLNGGICEVVDEGSQEIRRYLMKTHTARNRRRRSPARPGPVRGAEDNSNGDGGGYVCQCPKDYQGKHCEEHKGSPQPCDSQPCQNGGTCHNEGGAHWCQCPTGYNGRHCQIAEKPESCDSSPCQHGGICRDDGHSYWCICRLGFEGRNCEKKSPSPCESGPCYNQGTCHEHEDGGYWCDCPPGYTGYLCLKDTPTPCSPSPCDNGGTCHPDGSRDYWCECPGGYKGRHCETEEAPACDSQPCHNGGTCHNDGGGYWCDCTTGYEGRHCETEDGGVPSCDSQPCRNGGTCHNDGGGYWCDCPTGYEGRHCETEEGGGGQPCDTNSCHNGGTCHPDGQGYRCECPPGYGGDKCETPDSTPGDVYDCEANNPCTPENLENGDFYWPHADPAKFVQCDQYGGCYVMDCPPGSVWDQENLYCVHPPSR